MEVVEVRTDGGHSVVETTDSTAALYGSDSNYLSDSEDSMDTSIPREESPMPSISAFKGIGSWADDILDSGDHLRLQQQLLVPETSSEAKAVILETSYAVGKKPLSTDFHCRRLTLVATAVCMLDEAEDEQPPIIPSGLGPTRYRCQHHTSLFSTEGDGGPVIRTRKGDWKGGALDEGDLENQRDSDRLMKKPLNNNNNVLRLVLLMFAAGLSMMLSCWFWTY